MTTLNKSFIPANPGFYIVQPIEENNKVFDTVIVPVIGWLLDDAIVVPVTMSSVCEDNMYPILTPSGSVIDTSETVYDNIQSWMTGINERGL